MTHVDLDIILWSRVRADNNEAFETLFRKYYPMLCLFSKRYTNDMITSREVVQDIFIHLWEHRFNLDINTSFISYLTTAVKFNSIRRVNNDRKEAIRMAVLPDKNIEFYDHFELLPIEELWLLSGGNSRESIFSLQASRTEDIRNQYPAAFNFHMSRGWSDAYPELQFFYDFPEGPRKDFTFRTDIPNRGFVNGVVVDKDPPTIPWQISYLNYCFNLL